MSEASEAMGAARPGGRVSVSASSDPSSQGLRQVSRQECERRRGTNAVIYARRSSSISPTTWRTMSSSARAPTLRYASNNASNTVPSGSAPSADGTGRSA